MRRIAPLALALTAGLASAQTQVGFMNETFDSLVFPFVSFIADPDGGNVSIEESINEFGPVAGNVLEILTFVDPIFDVDPLPENEIFIDVFADFFTPVWNTAEDGPILGVRFELDVESSSDIEGVFFTITSFPFGFADGFQSFAPSFEDDFETIVAEFPIGQGFNGDPDFFTNNGPEFSFGFAFSRSVFDFSETGFLDPDYEGDQFLATFDNFRVLIITESGCSPADLVPPFGVISQADVAEFVSRFFANDPRVAVLAPPTDVVSQADVAEFVNLFFAGCPAG